MVCSQAVLFAASVVGETFLMTGVNQINVIFHLSRSNTKISMVLLINKEPMDVITSSEGMIVSHTSMASACRYNEERLSLL